MHTTTVSIQLLFIRIGELPNFIGQRKREREEIASGELQHFVESFV